MSEPDPNEFTPADDPKAWKVVNPPGVGQRVDVTFRPMIGGDDGYFAKVAAKMREDIARAFSGAAPKARFMVRRGTCPGCGVYVEPGGSCQCTA